MATLPSLPAEELGAWYLRLNGYLVIRNFLCQALNSTRRTEIDIVGVRFPHRAEMMSVGFLLEDDQELVRDPSVTDLVFAEVKFGLCDVNNALVDPARKNLEYALEAIGLFPPRRQALVAKALYANGAHAEKTKAVRIVALGDRKNDGLVGAQQITWDTVLGFVHKRFSERGRLPIDDTGWDDYGKYLHRAGRGLSLDKFVAEVRTALVNANQHRTGGAAGDQTTPRPDPLVTSVRSPREPRPKAQNFASSPESNRDAKQRKQGH